MAHNTASTASATRKFSSSTKTMSTSDEKCMRSLTYASSLRNCRMDKKRWCEASPLEAPKTEISRSKFWNHRGGSTEYVRIDCIAYVLILTPNALRPRLSRPTQLAKLPNYRWSKREKEKMPSCPFCLLSPFTSLPACTLIAINKSLRIPPSNHQGIPPHPLFYPLKTFSFRNNGPSPPPVAPRDRWRSSPGMPST